MEIMGSKTFTRKALKTELKSIARGIIKAFAQLSITDERSQETLEQGQILSRPAAMAV